MGILNPSPIRIPANTADQPAWLAKVVEEKQEESSVLEFKRGATLMNLRKSARPEQLTEFAKDISGMANAGGGLINYGIAEEVDDNGTKVAAGFDLIPADQADIESVDQRCRSRISPAIDGLLIAAITPAGYQPSEKCLVIEIPQSDTAHQCSVDGKYYRRGNATSDWMKDYEVREVMGRRKHPDVRIKVILDPTSDDPNRRHGAYHVAITNHGSSLCRFYRATLVVPFYVYNVGSVHFITDEPSADTKNGHGQQLVVHDEGSPLFPGMTRSQYFSYVATRLNQVKQFEPLNGQLLVRLYADDMPCREEWVEIKNIIGKFGDLGIT